ncbi:WbqC family protein (plasmid) [Aliiroseovarius crassostreae]|uniref:WbqC family protein n=1 Tax=Aliiroseovarius crassostreae TaxID=154981 RepID=A0A9Q9HCF5_9RHOB|nr:WbqC family protein [Aliiroseovarius crassostreae]UWP93930.1 WbqC family protein [Aliiroseovarius crassostreae]UWP97078.1 WbqC family protein [Aliiroseovarius crassostreae]UWQ00265.1 WbqC family protein [Aliiroseovarius crassostreae]
MIVGIMQPYFFPYFGYFQHINATDRFIIHDDVQFIKGGWIARNRLSKNGTPEYFRVTVQKAPVEAHINAIEAPQFAKDMRKVIGQFESFYAKTPNRKLVLDILRDMPTSTRISDINVHYLRKTCEVLGITTPIELSSDLNLSADLRATDKVIGLVKAVGGTHYINPIGGKTLYFNKDFSEAGLKLNFLRMAPEGQPEGWGNFLSVLDLIARNPIEDLQAALGNYTLEEAEWDR